MPVHSKKVEYKEFVCDNCGLRQEIEEGTKMSGWLTIIESNSHGLRLFEKKQVQKRYESFHVPNKKEKVYCNRACASEKLRSSVDLFLSEILDNTHQSIGKSRLI